MKKHYIFLILIVLVAIPLVWPFLKPGYFPTHDGEWAVVRLGAMHRAFIDHHFPVRWGGNLNFGYGYPLFHFTYPLPYYIGEVFHLLGIGLVSSIKLLFVLSVLGSGLSMFLLARSLFGNMGGFISTIFYLYAPYRLVNLYVRGSIGESLALIFFPLLFWLVLKIRQSPSWRYISLFAVGFGALLLTHNATALVFTPFLVFLAMICIYQSKEQRLVATRLCVAFALGVMLASFFLVPALFDKQHIVVSQTKLTHVASYFASFEKLVLPSWGYGAYGEKDEMSVQIGFVHLIGAAIAFFVFWMQKKRELYTIPVVFCLVSLLILLFLVLPYSILFWQYAPLYSDVDFPWRVLNPAIFFASVTAGALALHKNTLPVAFVLLALVVIVTLPYAKPQGATNFPDGYYFTNEATTTSADELMPLWVKEKPTSRGKARVEIVEGKGIIDQVAFRSTKLNFVVQTEEKTKLRLNTIYFPGWQVNVDGKKVDVSFNNPKGVIELAVGKGNHTVEAKFVETPLRLFADGLSILAAILVVGMFYKGNIPKWRKS